MSRKNSATRIYMEDNEHFADAFNYIIYNGNKIIRPEELMEQDPTELVGILDGDNKFYYKERYRDILKKCIIKKDKKSTYVMMGIENQSEIHYAMPVRNMLYDALNYTAQVNEKANEHRKNKDIKGAEFLSGFAACDKIIPIVTLIMYFGDEDWDAPRSLYEMFDDVDDNIKKLVSDYRINILVPKEIKNTKKFNTDLRYVMDFIKVSKDMKELKRLIADNKNIFEEMSKSAAMVLKECTSIKIETSREDKVINMCKAIEDMMEEARIEEREKAKKETDKLKQEAKEDKIRLIIKYYFEELLPLDKAVKDSEMTKEEFLQEIDKYKSINNI